MTENRGHDDVAIIGLACRFPGGANSEDTLWQLLAERKSAYSKVPETRYNVEAFHQPGMMHLNNLSGPGAHFLHEDVSAFDAPFFNITATEAKAMDPTARMLLESSYEAVENAGIPIESLAGSATGCYVGCFTRDYHELLMGDAESAPMYSGTGTGFSLFSNRISWYYDLRGPSLTLDTACSSSLVGVHLACQSLKSGETGLALVSGANLLLAPHLGMWLSNLHMISHEGLSRSFAEGVSGYGRGEGIATVVLKRLEDAIRDGDPIRAIIKGTGVNQDGHTKGITVPNPNAQSDLIRSTYRSAGLNFADTGYFEAHGTGTGVGDPLELNAVARVIKESGRQEQLLVGSIKSNIGHLEGAAGLAGLIKCVLMLESSTVLPNIHFDRPNKRIPFGKYRIKIPTDLMPWPERTLRRASVNSFGYGGTNAHVILDAFLRPRLERQLTPPLEHCSEPTGNMHQHRVFIFSGKDEASLDRIRLQFSEFTKPGKHLHNAFFLDDLSFTLGCRRSRLEWTAYHVASTVQELHEKLLKSNFTCYRRSEGFRVGFIFTGQGAQWPRMGLELMQYDVFRNSVLDAERFLLDELKCSWRLLDVLGVSGKQSELQRAEYSQPICSILQVAMVDLLRSWNICPVSAVGHSSGELAAAYCVGALSRQAVWELSYHRGYLSSRLKDQEPTLRGSMMALGLGVDHVRPYLEAVSAGRVNVACINSPSSVTVSGDASGIRELVGILSGANIFARELKVENAYHSHHMSLIAEQYLQSIQHIKPLLPEPPSGVRMISSVTGKDVSFESLSAEYWVQNLVSPVLFSDAVKSMSHKTSKLRRHGRKAEAAVDFLLEIGPHAALKGPLRQIIQSEGLSNVDYASMLMRGRDAIETAVSTIGLLVCHGCPVDVAAANNSLRPRILKGLPSYPWNNSHKYWATSRLTNNFLNRSFPRHNLLGTRLVGSDSFTPSWRHFLNLAENPWVRDHVVHGALLYPGAGILAMAIEAARQMADTTRTCHSVRLRDVRIHKALVISGDQASVEVITRLKSTNHSHEDPCCDWWEFTIFSCTSEDSNLEENAFGKVKIEYSKPSAPSSISGWQIVRNSHKARYHEYLEDSVDTMDPNDFYQATRMAGLDYGPSFQGIERLARRAGSCNFTIQVQDTKASMPGTTESSHVIHPTTLDIILHTLFAAVNEGAEFEAAAVPVAFDDVFVSMDGRCSTPGEHIFGLCTATKTSERVIEADIYASDSSWQRPLVAIRGIKCTELVGKTTADIRSGKKRAPLGTIKWKPDIHMLDEAGLRSVVGIDQNLSQSLQADTPSPPKISEMAMKPIIEVINLMAFKNPSLSILQVDSHSFGMTDILLSALEVAVPGGLPSSHVTVAEHDAEAFTRAMSDLNLSNGNMTVVQLHKAEPLPKQALQGRTFDLIIVVSDTMIDCKWNFLLDMKPLISTGGLFALIQPATYSSANKDSTQACIFKNSCPHSWSETIIEYRANEMITTIMTGPSNEIPSGIRGPLCILLPKGCSDGTMMLASLLSDQLSQLSIDSTVAAWQDTSCLEGKDIVALLEVEKPFLSALDTDEFQRLRTLVLKSRRLLWVCSGKNPHMGTAVGWLRVLQNENMNTNLQYLLLDNHNDGAASDAASNITKVILADSQEREYEVQDGQLCISRWWPDPDMVPMTLEEESKRHGVVSSGSIYLTVKVGHDGVAENARFVGEAQAAARPQADEVEIDIKQIRLTQDEIHRLDQQSLHEASGIVLQVGTSCCRLRQGDTVCFGYRGQLCSRVVVKEAYCQEIPKGITMEQAALLPLTYSTASRLLFGFNAVQPGQTVLVQAGASPVDQAIVTLALRSQAIVYCTAKNPKHTELLKGLGVPVHRILDDEDPDLSSAISILTSGHGIDKIVSTAGDPDTKQLVWKSVAAKGSFVQLVNLSDEELGTLDIRPFRGGATFSALNTDLELCENPSWIPDTLTDLVERMPDLSAVVAQPHAFSANDLPEALQYSNTNETMQSTTLGFGDDSSAMPSRSDANEPFQLHRNATYVLSGGFGGIGKSLAKLLVAEGARHLLFLSRSGAKTAAANALLEELAAAGVDCRASACDITDKAAVANVVKDCRHIMPPIRGVIQAATVVRDAVFDNMTFDDWQANLKPKIEGSWNLHTQLPEDMDFFIMLGSMVALMGHRSQAAYAAGNTFQDALAHYRHAKGLPAVTIDLGAMLDVGAVTDGVTTANFSSSEVVWMKETEMLAIVTMAMSGSVGDHAIPAQVCTGLPSGGILQQEHHEQPMHYERPFFALLSKLDTTNAVEVTADVSEDVIAELIALISQAQPEDATKYAVDILRARLAKDLRCSIDDIDAYKPLHVYGIDSLMAVDLRAWILMKLQADVSLFDVLNARNLGELAAKVVKVSVLVRKSVD